jgi:hypothetical protein
MTSQSDMAATIKIEQLDLFSKKRRLGFQEVSKIFDTYHIWEFIDDAFEGLHVQGPLATYEDISAYIRTKDKAA